MTLKKPLTPFMTAVLSGASTEQIARMLGEMTRKKEEQAPEPLRGDGFVVVPMQRELREGEGK